MGGGVAVAGVVAATVAGSAADAIHSLPAVGDSFELVGAAYTLWFMRRFLSSNLGRQELATTLRSISPPPTAAPSARRSASAPPPRRSQRSRNGVQPAASPMVAKADGVDTAQAAAAVSSQAPSVAAGNGVFFTARSGSAAPPSVVSRAARAHAARMAVRARRAPRVVAPKTVTLKSSVPGQSAVSLSLQAPVRTPLRVGAVETDSGMEVEAQKTVTTGTAAVNGAAAPRSARRRRAKRAVTPSISTRSAVLRSAESRARRARAVGGLGGPAGPARAAATVMKAAAAAAIKIAVSPVARAVAAPPAKAASVSTTVVQSPAKRVEVPVTKAPAAPVVPKASVTPSVKTAAPAQAEVKTLVQTGSAPVKAVVTSPAAPAHRATHPTISARSTSVPVSPAGTTAAPAGIAVPARQKRSVADRVLAPFRSRAQPAVDAAPAHITMAPVSSTVTAEIVAKYRGWRFVRKRTLPTPVGMYSTQEGQPRSAAAVATTSLFVSSGLNWGGWRSGNVALSLAPGGTLTALSQTTVADAAFATAAGLPAAAASAAAAIPEAAATAAAELNAAAAEVVAAFPSAARGAATGFPAAATKAAATASRTLANGDMSFGGWRFAGYARWRDEAVEEARSTPDLPTHAAAPAGAVQLAAAAAVATARKETASRPPAPKPHRPWSRSEWLSSTMTSQNEVSPSIPANAYVAPTTRRRGGRMDRTKLPSVTQPYENEYLVREI